jgi:hypothetical protein
LDIAHVDYALKSRAQSGPEDRYFGPGEYKHCRARCGTGLRLLRILRFSRPPARGFEHSFYLRGTYIGVILRRQISTGFVLFLRLFVRPLLSPSLVFLFPFSSVTLAKDHLVGLQYPAGKIRGLVAVQRRTHTRSHVVFPLRPVFFIAVRE